MTLREAEPATVTLPAQSAAPQPGDTDDAPEIARLAALWLRAERARQRAIVLRAQGQAIRAMRTRASAQELLAASPLARLQARLETMPVIEQAKGILMAEHRCGPDEAFDLLRRASQSANVRISVLAARMVEQIASPEPQANRGEPSAAPARSLPPRSRGDVMR